MKHVRISSLKEMEEFAEKVLGLCQPLKHAVVLALYGDLGSGKTTFVQFLGKALEVEEAITSPTFLIMKRYKVRSQSGYKNLVHVDAYRIEDEDELRVLHFEDIRADQANIIAIEWAERVSGLLPDDATNITFVLNQDGSRTITYGK